MALTQSIIQWIRENCRQIPAEKSISEHTRLLDENWLDSLQIMHLVSFLEKEYQISVDVEEMVPENFETAECVSLMVTRLRNNVV